LSVISDIKVFKYHYTFKLLKEMESKFIVMGTRYLVEGIFILHGRHLESRMIFLNEKGVVLYVIRD